MRRAADLAVGGTRVVASEVGERPTRPARESTVTAELWRRFRADGDDEAREQLILHYAPLVKYVAGRIAAATPTDVEYADLLSYGVIGLIDAIARFDDAAGASFETYAMVRIRGAVLDELRAVDWVPRRVRERTRDLEQAMRTLEARLHRAPTDDELAAELGWSAQSLDEAFRDAAATTVGALELDEVGDRPTLADTLWDLAADAPELLAEERELRAHLRDAVRALPEREQTVLLLYYYEGFTLGQICDVLDVSESRVCQLHAKAVMTLRTRLT